MIRPGVAAPPRPHPWTQTRKAGAGARRLVRIWRKTNAMRLDNIMLGAKTVCVRALPERAWVGLTQDFGLGARHQGQEGSVSLDCVRSRHCQWPRRRCHQAALYGPTCARTAAQTTPSPPAVPGGPRAWRRCRPRSGNRSAHRSWRPVRPSPARGQCCSAWPPRPRPR